MLTESYQLLYRRKNGHMTDMDLKPPNSAAMANALEMSPAI